MTEQQRLQRDEAPLRVSIPLGRWAGVPVGAHWSVLLAVALFATLLSGSVLPDAAPKHATAEYWLTGCVTAVVFFATLLAHELAHAVLARHYGMTVKRITLWMLGGFTQLDGDPPTARADAVVAGAGPATSIGIGIVGGLTAFLLNSESLPVMALAWLAGVNVLLGVFNLLPGAPLDGGRLLRAIVWWRTGNKRRAVEASTRAGRALGAAMIALGLFETLLGMYGGLWLALVGWFIMSSATVERSAQAIEGLHELRVSDVMAVSPASIPQWWTVAEFLERVDAAHARQPVFPLIDFEGRAVGVVCAADLERVGVEERATVRMRDVPHAARMLLAQSGASVSDLAAALAVHRGAAVVVDDAGRPVGLVTAEDVARARDLAHLGWTPHQDASVTPLGPSNW